MTNEEKIRLAFERMGNHVDVCFLATVTNNYPDKDYIDVRDLNGTLYPDVRKRAAITGDSTGILITPVTGSSVIVGRISESDELFIEMYSEVESIIINGGELGGLIKIQELTTKLNALVKTVNDLILQFNTHTHTVNTTGTAVAQAGVTAPISTPAQRANDFKAGDYENEKIKH